MIGADPEGFWKLKCFNQARGDNPFSPEALAEYLNAFADPDAIHASCEDYRAAATIDITHDDTDQGRKLHMPVLTLWAKRGVIEVDEAYACAVNKQEFRALLDRSGMKLAAQSPPGGRV